MDKNNKKNFINMLGSSFARGVASGNSPFGYVSGAVNAIRNKNKNNTASQKPVSTTPVQNPAGSQTSYDQGATSPVVASTAKTNTPSNSTSLKSNSNAQNYMSMLGNWTPPIVGQNTQEVTKKSPIQVEGTYMPEKDQPKSKYMDFLSTFFNEDDYKTAQKERSSALEELNRVKTDYLNRDVQARRNYESILDRPGGTVSGAQQSVAMERRRSTQELADLSLVEMAAQGRFNVANDVYTQLLQSGATQAEALRAQEEADNKVLSFSDAQGLGVPYGTTFAQARAMGITPTQTPKYTEVSAGATLFDPTTGRPVYTAPKQYAESSGDLTSKQYTALNQVTTRFQADPIINQALRGTTAATIADQIIADPSSATNQLKSLYALVKNLDPDSAVREGELALANQTQSYMQQFGNTLARITEGRVVSPEAAVALAEATKELMGAWNSTAKRRESQYTSQAGVLGIGNEFGTYLQGSNLGYSNQPQSPQIDPAWMNDYNYDRDIEYAREAIQQGENPEAVKQMLLQKYKNVNI